MRARGFPSLAFVVLITLGCREDKAQLDGAPCPCATGFACCLATDTCMPVDLADCPLAVTAVAPTSGPERGGTVLTINTSEVPLDLEITVGDSPCAQLESVDATTVRCVTTAGVVGVVDVQASTDRGRQGVLPDAFEYLATPDAAPTGCADCPLALTELRPGSGPVAGGTRVGLVGDGFREGMTVHFGAAPCADLFIGSPTEASCVTPPGDPATPWVDVVVDTADESSRLPRGFRYLLPAFTDITPQLGSFEITGPEGSGVTVADFNADGIRDVYFSRTVQLDPQHAGLITGLGALKFELPAGQLGLADLPLHESMVPGDFTGDGVLDLVANYISFQADREQGNLVLLVGREGGGFSPPVPIELAEIDTRGGQDHPVFVVDDDGDGDLDLLGCRHTPLMSDPSRYVLRVENQAGVLRETPVEEVVQPGTVASDCDHVAVGDYDADGDPDLALCGQSIRVYRNDAGRFVDVTGALGMGDWLDVGGRLPTACRHVRWVDVDADGRLDLAWMGDGTNPAQGDGVFIARNDGESFVSLEFDLAIPAGDEACVVAATGRSITIGYRQGVWLDADNDGDVDLLLPSPYWFRSCFRPPYLLRSQIAQGERAFSIEPQQPEPAFGMLYMSTPTGTAAADLDGDGDQDVVVNAWGARRRFVLRNNHREGEPPERYLVIAPITDPDGDATDADRTDDRLAPLVTIHLDLDGPDDAPDFTPGQGKLRVAHIPTGLHAHVPAAAHFGLGPREAPVWVRVKFSDGTEVVERVEDFDTRVEIRDR